MSTYTAGGSGLPLPPVPVVDGFDLLTCSRREHDVHDLGWFFGYVEGVRAGHAQAADEAEAAWASMAARVAAQGGGFARPWSAMCDLRGEPGRAARAREHEARIAAGVDADV